MILPTAEPNAVTVAVPIIFAATYLGVAVGRVPYLKLDRTGIALLGAIGIMALSGLPTQAVIGFINWPTILLLFGFLVLSAQLRLSGFFDRAAALTASRLGHPARFLLLLMVVAAGLSAVLNHDIVCFAFAPLVGAALLRRGLNPIPFLVALAIASNIGAAATLVGNPQDMMIAQVAGLGFARYLAWCITPVMVALGSAYGIIWALSRHHLALTAPASTPPSATPRPFNRFHTMKGLIILGLVVALFFSPLPKELVALTAAGIHLASPTFRTEDMLGLVDWEILVLFMGLFVVTGALEASGYGAQMAGYLAHHGLDLASLPVLALATAALSNLINNAAAVMLLLKLAPMTHPHAAYVLALANSFGGSLIILGSVSNIIVVQQAREMDINIRFRDFARLGVPVTLAALAGLLGWVAVVT
ncbi:MAG TPA: SLC13 family permease [Gemmatimonadales bacterium]|nr:SLC13 family permease [Gemmatimonadales bacterium]